MSERDRLLRGLELALADQRAHGIDVLPNPVAPTPPPTAEPATGEAPAACDRETDLVAATSAIAELDRVVSGCVRCPLAAGRTKTVFGEGSATPRLMFIGEGPGADEDRTGRPFVGRAGQLLDKMIQAMTLRREDVYIANVVKCRPPGNRAPNPEETNACIGYLHEQIRLLCPEVICTLGSPATKTILESDQGIMRTRGRRFPFPRDPRVVVIPTFHPAYLLRRPEEKAKAWSDLQIVMAELGLAKPSRG